VLETGQALMRYTDVKGGPRPDSAMRGRREDDARARDEEEESETALCPGARLGHSLRDVVA
jgi:hypothetical protein